jgi:hypothetical protein
MKKNAEEEGNIFAMEKKTVAGSSPSSSVTRGEGVAP